MANLRELIAQLKLFCQLDVAFCDKIEEQDKQIYALQEDNKRLKASVHSLERRYSELLYAFGSYKKEQEPKA